MNTRDGVGRWAFASAFVAGMLAVPLWAQPKIEITSPRDGAVVRPGSTVTVSVTVSPQQSFRMVAILTQDPLKTRGDMMLSAPPYRFTVEVPSDLQVSERYGITATGLLVGGGSIDDGPINIDVERSDPPLRLETDLRTIYFDYVGDAGHLNVYGFFADGSKVDLTHSSLTKYTSG